MSEAPCIPGLIQPRVHPIADTSLRAYEHILKTLSQRERAVLLALCDAPEPLTGGEVAERMGTLTTSVRPRLTALIDKGLVEKLPARLSTARYESFAHPHRAVLTRAAVERAIQRTEGENS